MARPLIRSCSNSEGVTTTKVIHKLNVSGLNPPRPDSSVAEPSWRAGIRASKTTYVPNALPLLVIIGLYIETIGNNTQRHPQSVHLGHQSFIPSNGVACPMGIAVTIMFPEFGSLFWAELNCQLNSRSARVPLRNSSRPKPTPREGFPHHLDTSTDCTPSRSTNSHCNCHPCVLLITRGRYGQKPREPAVNLTSGGCWDA